MKSKPKTILSTKQAQHRRLTKYDLAKYYGLTNFDGAIPQALFDALATNDFNPHPNYVYDYSEHTTPYGALFPLTKEAIVQMESALNMEFVDPRLP